ncbi:hypothetical protein D3C87_47870 [compost metagenome]
MDWFNLVNNVVDKSIDIACVQGVRLLLIIEQMFSITEIQTFIPLISTNDDTFLFFAR